MQSLVNGAEDAKVAFENDDITMLGKCLRDYWEQKKVMAGDDSNVEPSAVGKTLRILYELNEIISGSLCDAGGGGFLVLLARDGRDGMGLKTVLESSVKNELKSFDDNHDNDVNSCILEDFTWHTYESVEHGLIINIDDNGDDL